MKKIPIEISARHIHLCQRHLEKLFGKGYKLKKLKNLSQPGDFSAKETVIIKAGKREIRKVRIVGPLRKETQVELSKTDAVNLKINPPILLSGNLKKSAGGVVLVGPKGKVFLKKGVIIAKRHIHCHPKEAADLGLKDKDEVSLRVKGERGITFHNVAIRIKDNYKLCCHLDTDEGNAAGINKKSFGFIVD